MSLRQRAVPRRWLMTDERMGNRLSTGIAWLPPGDSGIVFRHYATPQEQRLALARQIRNECSAREIMFAIAANCAIARDLDADLVHNPERACSLPFSRSVHSLAEAIAARSEGAALVFVSPVHATRSHPDRTPLGASQAANIALAAGVPAIALGGMDEMAFAALPAGAFHGWAAIDAWIGEQMP